MDMFIEESTRHHAGEATSYRGPGTSRSGPALATAPGSGIEEWIVHVLGEQGACTLDELGLQMPASNWAQLFLAVDRLTRRDTIRMWPDGPGTYRLQLAAPAERHFS